MPEQENQDDFTKVIIGLTKVETKIDGLGNVRELAIEAQQSAKSAHLRVDRLDRFVFWMGTTVSAHLSLVPLHCFSNLQGSREKNEQRK